MPQFEECKLGDVNQAKELYNIIRRDQLKETYMGVLMLGGERTCTFFYGLGGVLHSLLK